VGVTCLKSRVCQPQSQMRVIRMQFSRLLVVADGGVEVLGSFRHLRKLHRILFFGASRQQNSTDCE